MVNEIGWITKRLYPPLFTGEVAREARRRGRKALVLFGKIVNYRTLKKWVGWFMKRENWLTGFGIGISF